MTVKCLLHYKYAFKPFIFFFEWYKKETEREGSVMYHEIMLYM